MGGFGENETFDARHGTARGFWILCKLRFRLHFGKVIGKRSSGALLRMDRGDGTGRDGMGWAAGVFGEWVGGGMIPRPFGVDPLGDMP